MIRIDEIWLSSQPLDMRAGMDSIMAQVVRALGYIKPHCAYLFCNKRGHRMNEPYRVCRRLNILRDYSDEKTKLYPRN